MASDIAAFPYADFKQFSYTVLSLGFIKDISYFLIFSLPVCESFLASFLSVSILIK